MKAQQLMADTNKAPEDASARRTWTLPVSIGAAVLIVLLIVSGIWLLIDRQSIRDRDERREAYLQAARQTVLNLTTIHSDTADADVQRLLDGATGDFKAEFEGREGPFVEVVQKAGGRHHRGSGGGGHPDRGRPVHVVAGRLAHDGVQRRPARRLAA